MPGLAPEQYQEWLANPDLHQLALTTGLDPSYAVQPPAPAPTAAPPPAQTAAPTQTAPQTFDVNAYLAANPDLTANWNAGGSLHGMGDTLQDAAMQHYYGTGGLEIARGERGGAPALSASMAVPTPVPDTIGQKASGDAQSAPVSIPQTSQLNGVTQALPADPSKGLSTAYFPLYTNSGDLNGGIPAVDGNQRVRLIDPTTGQVVAEGSGQSGAQHIADVANQLSQDKGRKAAWQVQYEFQPDQFTTVGYDKADPKHNTLGKLLEVAAPFLLAAVFPPLAGVASALGATGAAATVGNAAILGALANTGAGLVQGENLGTAVKGGLTSGALSGLTAGALGALPSSITSPINNALSGVQGVVNKGVNAIPGLNFVTDPINSGLTHILDSAGNVVGTVRGGVDAARTAVRSALGLGGAGGASGPFTVSAGDVAVLGGGFSPADFPGVDWSAVGGVSALGGALTPPGPGAEVSPVTVTGQPSFTVPGLTPPGPGTEVSPVDVVAQPNDTKPGLTPPGPGVEVSPVTIMPEPTPVTVPDLGVPTPPTPAVTNVTPLPDVPPTPNPTIPGIPVATTGSGKYSVSSLAGTRASLSPIYTASLPSPTMGTRTPLPAHVDARYAIEHPEAAFWSNVRQPSTADFAVMTPAAARAAGISDMDGDGVITEHDVQLWRARFGGKGFAHGGYAVGGPGDGREDAIPARLSDGEYVVDAETVALLGNGSSKAGAKRLDDFRVNIRKQKGRDLAKGKFSAKAKAPEAYVNA